MQQIFKPHRALRNYMFYIGGITMSRSKKIIGLVLAVVMVFASFTMAFAFEDPADKTATVAIVPAASNIEAGASTTVSVKVTTNFTVGTFSIPVFYEKANVTVSGITVPSAAGYSYSESATAVDAAKVFASAGLDSATYGFVMVTYIPSAGTATSTLNDSEVLSFTVTANAGASGTVNFQTVEASRKTSTNVTGTLYIGSIASDTINAVPVNVEATGLVTSAAVTIGSAAQPADLALTEKGTTDGVVIDTRMTFGGQYAGVVYGFNHATTATFRSAAYLNNSLQVTNGGSWTLGRSVGTVGYGTGTTITINNADGSANGKVYVVVIFGDVNGDGLINGNDTTACKGYVANAASLTNLAVRMAANCQNIRNATMMYNLNGNDTTAIKAYVGNATNKVSQAELAATIAGLSSVHTNYR